MADARLLADPCLFLRLGGGELFWRYLFLSKQLFQRMGRIRLVRGNWFVVRSGLLDRNLAHAWKSACSGQNLLVARNPVGTSMHLRFKSRLCRFW